MLALRSTLLIDALDDAALAAAERSAADAVAIDLASPAVHAGRAEARAVLARRVRTIAAARRPLHVRVSDTRSAELDADLDAAVRTDVAAIILAGAEAPQDVRDVDVAIRKREMRLRLVPGGIRLIAEVDSAEGLQALPRILDAVDRHEAVALSVDGLRADLRLAPRTDGRACAVLDHAMAQVALAARAARLPWLLAVAGDALDAPALATRAHEYGAAGVVLRDESAVRGMNALYTPDPTEVAQARAMLLEWERVRASGAWVGATPAADGQPARLVDRRTVRAARALVALAAAIEARERAK